MPADTHLLSTHQDVVAALQEEGDFIVAEHSHGRIVLLLPWTRHGSRDMTKFCLLQNSSGWFLEPAKKPVRYRTSHYDYPETEERFCRDKGHIVAFIKRLKRSRVWEIIINRDSFIQLNKNNGSIDKRVIGKELRDLLG
jgi:hypothetical protein